MARSVHHFGPDDVPPLEMYVPLAQYTWGLGHVLMNTERRDLSAAVSGLVAELGPRLPPPVVRPYTSYLSEWFAPLRIQLVIVGTLGVVGTLLAALGLYALVAYHVTTRRREIGIRLALGAPESRLFIGVIRQGLVLSAVGVFLGFGRLDGSAPLGGADAGRRCAWGLLGAGPRGRFDWRRIHAGHDPSCLAFHHRRPGRDPQGGVGQGDERRCGPVASGCTPGHQGTRGREERTMRRSWVMTAAAAVLIAAPAAAQSAEDRAGVERAALDYLEGFYEGSTEKIERGVHPEVLKFGFYRPEPGADYQRVPMSFQGMLDFATNVKETSDFPGADAPKRVELLDVLDQTAVAKVHAWWGTDYLTMAKYEGEWKIVQVLWQSPPTE